jgi:N-acetyltransferase 10
LATLYFTGRLRPAVNLTGVQASILLAIGLQHKDLSALETELSLPSSQILSMFIKIMRKISTHFSTLVEGAIAAQIPARETIGVSRADADAALDNEVIDERFVPLTEPLDEELADAGDAVNLELREKQRELIDALPLDR